MSSATSLLIYLTIVGILGVQSSPSGGRGTDQENLTSPKGTENPNQDGGKSPGADQGNQKSPQGTENQNQDGGKLAGTDQGNQKSPQGTENQNQDGGKSAGTDQGNSKGTDDQNHGAEKTTGHETGTGKGHAHHQSQHQKNDGSGHGHAADGSSDPKNNPTEEKGKTKDQGAGSEHEKTQQTSHNPTASGDGKPHDKTSEHSSSKASEGTEDKTKKETGDGGGNSKAKPEDSANGGSQQEQDKSSDKTTKSDASPAKQEAKPEESKAASSDNTGAISEATQAHLLKVIQDNVRMLYDVVRINAIKYVLKTDNPLKKLILSGEELIKEERKFNELVNRDITQLPNEYFKPKIRVRLVNKKWKPHGLSSTENRNLPFFEGGSAQAYDAFELSTPYEYEERLLANALELLSTPLYNKDNPSIVILDTVDLDKNSKFLSKTITALAMRNQHQFYNIFAIDLSELTHYMSSLSFLYYKKVPNINHSTLGRVIGDFFVAGLNGNFMEAEKINLVGFGYSSRLALYISKQIEEATDGQKKIGTIFALNPLGSPKNPAAGPLTYRHAKVVHVLHTNSFPLGTMSRTGTADFILNNGLVQLECKDSKNPWLCSHRKALDFFWYVILYGAQTFEARTCSSYLYFYLGECDAKQSTFLTYPIVNTQVRGKFYLNTKQEAPYGLGAEGSKAEAGAKEKFLKIVQEKKKTDEGPRFDIETYKMMIV